MPAATSCCSAPSSSTSSTTSCYFKEYVVAYTNAATLVSEEFQDTEDLDGLFSGYDDEKGNYSQETWAYASADGETTRRPAPSADPRPATSTASSKSERGRR